MGRTGQLSYGAQGAKLFVERDRCRGRRVAQLSVERDRRKERRVAHLFVGSVAGAVVEP